MHKTLHCDTLVSVHLIEDAPIALMQEFIALQKTSNMLHKKLYIAKNLQYVAQNVTLQNIDCSALEDAPITL